MKAARLSSFTSPLSVEIVDEPRLIPGSVILRVLSVYIPTFTANVVDGKLPYQLPPLPTTPGPNAIGVIEEVADDVFDLSKGQIVFAGGAIYSDDAFSKNDTILIGWTTAGPHARRLQQIYKEGSWAEKFLVPSSSIVPFPESLTLHYSTSQLGVFSYIGIAYGALLRGDFRPGQVVVVNGATGSIGSGTVLLALSLGASRVIAVGRDVDTLNALQSLDPKRVFIVPLVDLEEDTKKIQALAAEADHPKYEGAHLFIDAIGGALSADPTIACMKALRRRGIAVFVGSVYPPVPVNYVEAMIKQIEIRGSFMSDRDSYGDLMRLAASGVLDINKIKVHTFPLDQINDAISKASTAKGLNWVVLEPSK